MASEKQQAGRALRRLARRNPLVALAIAAVLVVGAALGWFGAAGGGGAEDVAPDRNGQAAVISAEDNLQQAQVVRVVDGDTLKVSVPGDENATVRLIGMDTPESVAADEARNCEEGRIASDYAKSPWRRGRRCGSRATSRTPTATGAFCATCGSSGRTTRRTKVRSQARC